MNPEREIALTAFIQHPLPWRVERDWTWEVLDADGRIVAGCMTEQEAQAVVAWGENEQAENAKVLDDFGIGTRIDRADLKEVNEALDDALAYGRAREQDCLRLSHEFDEHPNDYDGPCMCALCRSYG